MRKKVFLGTTIIIFCLSSAGLGFGYEKEVKALCNAMVEKVAKAGKKNVAVVDFTDLQGNVTELGRFLAEEFSSDLSEGAIGFEIIDRNHLRSILTEHKLSLSGLVDPKTVKQLGQIAGVDALVTGTVTPFGDSIRVSGKVIATDTAKVIATAKGDIAKTKAIEELLAKGIETGSAPVTSKGAFPASKPATREQQVMMGNFQFKLQGCSISNQTVSCDFLVTNFEKDAGLRIYARGFSVASRIVDDSGNDYYATKIMFGNESNNSSVGKDMASNVPIKAKLSFEGVLSEPKLLSLLEIECDSRGRAQFKNIALSGR